jgi:hypothetical protein
VTLVVPKGMGWRHLLSGFWCEAAGSDTGERTNGINGGRGRGSSAPGRSVLLRQRQSSKVASGGGHCSKVREEKKEGEGGGGF